MKKIFINNLIIILIFFISFEIFLRVFNLADLKGHGKELAKKKNNVETVVFGKKVVLDKYGYRVPGKNFSYEDKLDKIIFIGDSVSFGSGVIEEETFIGKLRENNNDKTFINASIIGNDIPDTIQDIRKNFDLFKSKRFIIIYTLDDIIFNLTDENKKNETKEESLFKKIKKNYFLNKINVFLRSKSYVYLWIKGITTNPSERYFVESFNEYMKEESIYNLENKISEIRDLEKTKNIKIRFIILPYEYQTRNKCNLKLLMPQKKIKNILNKKGISFIDLTSNFCAFKKPKKLYLNFDPVHLSTKGHDFVFRILDKEISKKN